ncbi:hypothetical protein ACFSRY_05550 [Pontibacter locisalis]|uniref:Transmembrane protein n=1 Tax=Pontibacter locisalis TaxID=1719035 RepID=A0ABW5IJ65_9BACT
MSFLLSLRHWQAFLLIFVLPFLLQFTLPRIAATTGFSIGEAASTAIDALPTIFLTVWIWQVGVLMHRRLPSMINISAIYLHLGALYFVLYTMLLVYTFALVRESITEGTLPFGMLVLLLPMHLFATFCFLYMVYFTARSIVSVQHQRIVEFGEYAAVLLQIMFLPIGIWFLQSRLRQLPRL